MVELLAVLLLLLFVLMLWLLLWISSNEEEDSVVLLLLLGGGEGRFRTMFHPKPSPSRMSSFFFSVVAVESLPELVSTDPTPHEEKDSTPTFSSSVAHVGVGFRRRRRR